MHNILNILHKKTKTSSGLMRGIHSIKMGMPLANVGVNKYVALAFLSKDGVLNMNITHNVIKSTLTGTCMTPESTSLIHTLNLNG